MDFSVVGPEVLPLFGSGLPTHSAYIQMGEAIGLPPAPRQEQSTQQRVSADGSWGITLWCSGVLLGSGRRNWKSACERRLSLQMYSNGMGILGDLNFGASAFHVHRFESFILGGSTHRNSYV